MKILVITSCTGEKAVESPAGLTLADFQRGLEHVAARELEVGELMMSAEDIYTGQQHVRLMRGVKAFREAHPTNGAGPALELHVLSAGYGLVPGGRRLAPYEATFTGMKAKELRTWGDQLGIPTQIRELLKQPFDLGLLLLGDAYLKACRLDDEVELGGPVLAFCGSRMAKRLPELEQLTTVTLGNKEAKRFSCALVGLKGQLAGQLLSDAAREPSRLATLISAGGSVLDLLGPSAPGGGVKKRKGAIPNPAVDHVIKIPRSWQERTHRNKLGYFIPEWDDQVDPDYDFENDKHSGGQGDWSNQTYAHQMLGAPNYDGLLVSKVVAEASKKKRERINRMGVHRFLRVPRDYPIMGDCGAFGYIKEKVPPYSTNDVIDYYSRLGFDFGVSVDHLIVKATAEDAKARYELTINNAEEFLREHRSRGLPWTPIGAVQGWDPATYAAAAKQYVAMGYTYIGLGGLVRTSTKKLIPILEAVHQVVPSDVAIHVFGVARLNAVGRLKDLGVRSVDSASYLRQAWMRTKTSYVMPTGSYAAIRIPEAGKSFRAKRMTAHPDLDDAKILAMEQAALSTVRAYARRTGGIESALEALLEYDQFVTADRVDMEPLYRRTLEERPWERCPCRICQDAGVEVVIFRGNNRNRRRGFHNTYVFYRLFADIVDGHDEEAARRAQPQLQLFSHRESASAL